MATNRLALRGLPALVHAYHKAIQRESEHKRHLRRLDRRGIGGKIAQALKPGKVKSRAKIDF